MALLRDIARRAIDIFSSLGLQSCLIGGVACTLYGVQRVPNDVDLLVLTDVHSKAALQQMICDHDPNFFLVDPDNTHATYKILWYGPKPMQRCRLDILLPGIMEIPNVPAGGMEHRGGFPVMPLLPLLMLKLKVWEDHSNHPKQHVRKKAILHRVDVKYLLALARSKGIHREERSQSWIPTALVEETQRRVTAWARSVMGEDSEDWEAIGFETPHLRYRITPMSARLSRALDFVLSL